MPHIVADLNKPISNEISIYVRETSSLSVKITRDNYESVLTLDTTELAIGTHDLIIESYDENSSVKSALKTDTILILVTEYLRASKLPS